jgi:hypothetical protein
MQSTSVIELLVCRVCDGELGEATQHFGISRQTSGQAGISYIYGTPLLHVLSLCQHYLAWECQAEWAK